MGRGNEKEVEIFDIGVATYLSLKNHEFIRYNKHSDNIFSFVFEYSPQLEKDIADYEEMKGQVPPKPFINLFKLLRAQIIDLKRKNKKNRSIE